MSRNHIHISEKQLYHLLLDLVFGKFDSTFTTMLWVLLYVGSKPDIQRKIHDELRDKIGNRDIAYNDQKL